MQDTQSSMALKFKKKVNYRRLSLWSVFVYPKLYVLYETLSNNYFSLCILPSP